MPQYVTQYITPDDFRDYFGIDLATELKATVNPSDAANAFIKRIEDRMEVFLNANFFKNISVEYAKMSPFQKEHYRKALLEQAIYIFKNSDITVDSGYDPDEGIKTSMHALREIAIAPNAREHLKMTGLWSRSIRTVGWFDTWFGL